MRCARALAMSLAMILLVAGCGGESDRALDAAGPQSATIAELWWKYFAICAAVYGLTGLAIAGAAIVNRRAALEPPTTPAARPELLRGWIVAGAVVLSTGALFVMLIADYAAGQANNAHGPADLKLHITGKQWWWEVKYEDPQPSNTMTTAGEIHIPVGRTVEVELQSADVIHSFWVPQLLGKRDLVPGHPTRVFLKADRAGTFDGQCAEFCGYQHAKMRFLVVAEPPEEFEKWLAAQRQPAHEPTTDSQSRGRQIFLSTTCVMCHAIQGTPAGSKVGPDLTHVASRRAIASGSLPNARGHLAGWIADAQSVKPGVRMPPNPLSPADLQAVLDYISSLK
jgi:cytochrome c oxidase subunit 2